MINWKKEILTIPNLLSLLRLVLIPVYILVYLHAHTPSGYVTAGLILAVSCLTDMFDGKIARIFHQVTNLGKFLDPLADKLTQLALLICLGIRYRVLRTVFSLLLLKELFQFFAGILTAKKGYILKHALYSGKLCTAVLFLSLVTLVVFSDLNYRAVDLIALLDCLFLSVAFADYFITYLGRPSRFQPLDADSNNTI